MVSKTDARPRFLDKPFTVKIYVLLAAIASSKSHPNASKNAW